MHPSNAALRSAVLALVTVLAGCPKADPKPSPEPPAKASDGFLGVLDAEIALYLRCYGRAIFEDRAELESVAASVQAAVDAGRLIYVPAEQAACVASIQATTCASAMRDADFIGCVETVFVGAVAVGGDCGESVECVDGYCGFAAGTCPGTCVALGGTGDACTDDEKCQAGLVCDGVSCAAPVTVVAGGECDWSTLVCEAGSFCDYDNTSSTWYRCRAFVGLGEACQYTDECEVPLVCDTRATGTCLPYASTGDACASAACNPWLSYCGASDLCLALPTLGQPCGAAGRCAGTGVFCDTALATPSCSTLPVAGEDCSLSSQQIWPSCSGGAYCLTEWTGTAWTYTCTAPQVGGVCEDDGVCADGYYCDAVYPATGSCVPRVTSGDCARSEACAEGYYCTGIDPAPGSCAPQKVAGEACADWDECGGGTDCVGGLCSVGSCY